MKKRVMMMAAVMAMAGVMSGCSGSKPAETTAAPTAAAETTAAETTAAPETTAAETEAPEGSLAKRVIYPVAVIKNTAHADAANAFVEFLQSDDAMAVFESYGFAKGN